MKIKNKKGAEKIMAVYWFAILMIVAGAIVYMVSIFYGSPYDVREIETNILINKVADCISKEGVLNKNLFDEEEKFNKDFKILEECRLNFDTLDKEDQYYLEVNFYKFEAYDPENPKPLYSKITEGNVNIKTIFEVTPSSNSIFKSEKSFYVLNDQDEEIVVKILAIISKTKENVG